MQIHEGPNEPPCDRVGRLLAHAFGACASVFTCLLAPASLHAQGCALCYNSASAAGTGAKEALANGILILLIPSMVFFLVIVVVVYMYRNKFRGVAGVGRRYDREAGSADPILAEDDLGLAAEIRMLDEERALLVGDHELVIRDIPSPGYRP